MRNPQREELFKIVESHAWRARGWGHDDYGVDDEMEDRWIAEQDETVNKIIALLLTQEAEDLGLYS